MSGRTLRSELTLSVAAPLGLVFFVLAGWQIYVWLSDIRPQTLPGPIRIVRESVESAGSIWEHSLVTMSEVAAGFAISVVCALALGLLLDLSTAVRRALYPIIVASQTIPIPVVAPLMIVWFGFGVTPKIIVIGLFTFVPIVLGFAAGSGLDRAADDQPDAQSRGLALADVSLREDSGGFARPVYGSADCGDLRGAGGDLRRARRGD